MSDLSLSSSEAADPQRRAWLIATTAAGGVAAAATTIPFVASLSPSERARATGAAVEIDLSEIPAGGLKTVEWRGKPVWVMRRTPEMIAALSGQDDKLADPNSTKDSLPAALRNPGRSERQDIFIAIGICTHLGCSPSAVAAGTANPSVGDDWQGGFFCPCHASTFDLAGRVFKNKPAATNLEIPPHHFVSDARVVIGDEIA